MHFRKVNMRKILSIQPCRLPEFDQTGGVVSATKRQRWKVGLDGLVRAKRDKCTIEIIALSQRESRCLSFCNMQVRRSWVRLAVPMQRLALLPRAETLIDWLNCCAVEIKQGVFGRPRFVPHFLQLR